MTPLLARPELLLTGSSGYVGRFLRRHLSRRFAVTGLDRTSGHDLTRREAVEALFERVRPRLVVHCANFGNIRQCEADPQAASAVNVTLPDERSRHTSLRTSSSVFGIDMLPRFIVIPSSKWRWIGWSQPPPPFT